MGSWEVDDSFEGLMVVLRHGNDSIVEGGGGEGG